jgi:hypothetical protein
MILGFRGNDRLLHPCQKLLRLRQRQPQIAISLRSFGRLISSTSTLRDRLAEPTSSTIPQPATTRPVISPPSLSPHSLDTPINQVWAADITARHLALAFLGEIRGWVFDPSGKVDALRIARFPARRNGDEG